MFRRSFTSKLRQTGVALIAVLWIVAALSVIVASISRSARQEVRAVSSARQAVAGQALGLAAIQLVLQDMTSRSHRSQASTQVSTRFKDLEIHVKVLPLTGLIDINNGSQALLASAFAYAGMQPRAAAVLAASVAEARSAKDARGRIIGFEATEDLLRVPGVDYTLYAKISALITADLTGSGRVNPAAAPPEVLAVLAAGNTSRAAGIAAQQGAGQPGVDITALNGEFIDTNTYTQRFQLQARVPLPDGSWLIVSRTVDLSGGDNGLQWRVLHGDFRFEPVPAERI